MAMYLGSACGDGGNGDWRSNHYRLVMVAVFGFVCPNFVYKHRTKLDGWFRVCVGPSGRLLGGEPQLGQ